MIPDLSLNGVKNYGENKGGVHDTSHVSNDLRDLETLVNEMCQVRSGSSTSSACGCHGNEMQPSESATTCGSHSRSSYGSSTLSLSEIVDAIDSLPSCSCNANSVYDCICVSRCDCVSNCTCDCNYCGCDCDNCGCVSDYCTCVSDTPIP